jgi:hypothetical protein
MKITIRLLALAVGAVYLRRSVSVVVISYAAGVRVGRLVERHGRQAAG